jgi:hypothetical protein
MNRTQRVREVYRELKASTMGDVPKGELLRCASELVDLCDKDTDHSRFELRQGGLPFDCQALDVAFADGGWRVMYHEASRLDELRREEAMDLVFHNGLTRLSRGYAE